MRLVILATLALLLCAVWPAQAGAGHLVCQDVPCEIQRDLLPLTPDDISAPPPPCTALERTLTPQPVPRPAAALHLVPVEPARVDPASPRDPPR